MRSCNTPNDLSNKLCVPNKTEDLNLSVFDIITGINESKIITKHISRQCKCKFDGRKCNSNQKWNNYKSRCDCKNPKEHHLCKKDYIWNPSTCICEKFEYLASTVDASVIMCDEIINAADCVSTNVTSAIPTNMTNTISTIVTCTVLTNSDDKTVRYKKVDCYILRTVFLGIILLGSYY